MAGGSAAGSGSVPEHILKKQQYFRNTHRLTHLKGPYDRITSVAIPAAFLAVSMTMVARGIWNMAHGTGKKE